MEQYIVSARKYRPTTFASVVGQQALTNTLKNAIDSNRLAHAYLFCGSRGVGKTSCARIFAKTINCTNRRQDGEACNECDSCRQFNENRSLNIIELDAASNNGVDDIRDLIEQVMVPPATGRYRVFIVDEVHMLSTAAFNAFLKTLEEPPSYAVFILATTEKHKIIPTILSRCQIYDFNRISTTDMVRHLMHVAREEGITADPAALNIIAGKADGAMRDALSIFDQVAASSRGNVTYQATVENLNVLDHSYYKRLVDAFIAQDVPAALLIYKEIREKGFDSQFFINGLGMYMRDLMVASNPQTLCLLETTDDVRAEMAERAGKLHPTFLYRAMDLCNTADFNFRQASNKQFLIELTLIKLCQLLGPSPDESGSDGGQMKPLQATPAATAAAAPQPAMTAEPQGQYGTRPQASMPTQAPTQAPTFHAQQRPATQQATRPAAAGAGATPSYRPGGMSLHRMQRPDSQAPQQAQPTPTAATTAPTAARLRDYSEIDLENAWKKCAEAFPAEPVLRSTLAMATPEKISAHTYVLTVTSSIQVDLIEQYLPRLTEMLRNQLGNDAVTLRVVLNEGELSPQFWTEKQVLEHILKNHPDIGEMMSKYKMRLS